MHIKHIMLIVITTAVLSTAVSQNIYYFPTENYGGKQALKELIRSEMVYPDISRQNKEEGKVVIQCTVTQTGDTKHVLVVKSAGKHLDKEALRLFGHILWAPAQSKGAAIEDKSEIEIVFKLRKYQKNVRQRGYDQIKYKYMPVDKSLAIFQVQQLDSLPQPLFAEENMKFADFMIQNMIYPDDAKKRGVSGTVDLFFVVEPSGNSTNLRIEKGVGAGCNEEAKRLIKLLKWHPGIRDGMAVRTALQLSITFNLDNSNNMKYVPSNNSSIQF
jgi:TonB family protein